MFLKKQMKSFHELFLQNIKNGRLCIRFQSSRSMVPINTCCKVQPLIQKLDDLERNIHLRNHPNNIPKIRELLEQIKNIKKKAQHGTCLSDIESILRIELQKLPNYTHHKIREYGNIPIEIRRFNHLPCFTFKPKDFSEATKKSNFLRIDHLRSFMGHKSYYLLSALAEIEQALIEYSLNNLREYKFKLISVPDILCDDIIEGCGMQTNGERTQVYKLDCGNCLSGTSEMALAGYFSDNIIDEKALPIRVTAISRCFRAETSSLHEEKGIYRVHQFTKVEMFSICAEQMSNDMLEEFKNVEVNIFGKLGIHFKLLDMPPSELGAPAFRKYDIEAWMPGRNMWGEISSSSNCTDYQAKRLNIRYRTKNNDIKFAHTVNGTACAIPRLLIAMLEHYQLDNGTIFIPKELQKYMSRNLFERERRLPDIKLVKFIKAVRKRFV